MAWCTSAGFPRLVVGRWLFLLCSAATLCCPVVWVSPYLSAGVMSSVGSLVGRVGSCPEYLTGSLTRLGRILSYFCCEHSTWFAFKVNRSNNRYFKGNKKVWKALENTVKAKKVKAVWVPDFLDEDIENILSSCRIKPVVNQVVVHLSTTPVELLNYCKNKNILMKAYSQIAYGKILKNGSIIKTAQRCKVSAAPLCIEYALQLVTVVLLKTSSPKHMKSNTELNFKLPSGYMETLKNTAHIRDYEEFGIFPI